MLYCAPRAALRPILGTHGARGETLSGQTDTAEQTPQSAARKGGGRPLASPVAKRMAAELGLDLTTIEGSGPRGRIVRYDVEAAASGAAPEGGAAPEASEAPPAQAQAAPAAAAAPPAAADQAPAEAERVGLTKIQRLIADRMVESKSTAPDFALTTEVDMVRALALRAEMKDALDGPAPSINDMIVKACALALREFRKVNGSYVDGEFRLAAAVNVGMAVATPDALIVPTVFGADRKSLGEIAGEARGLAEKVRAGTIAPAELSGGTFTVSNLGMFGVDRFVAVLNPPQAGILAAGAVRERMRPVDGGFVPRSVMDLTLTCDHRILYGAEAAGFLARVTSLLERPAALVV
ncbi:MAG: 2-oxo acid dehydrogenase subunit E2 [Actinobacteria bacterium]|nr:2-oxo acid dehydrogenase subunit E2 [Actinomycetota bacterium]